MWGAPVSFRRLWNLTFGLPIESNLQRANGAHKPGDPVIGWSNVEELLAATVNELRGANYLFVKAHTKPGAHVPEPKTITRPGADGGQDKKRPLRGAALAEALKGRGLTVRYTPKKSPEEAN